MTDEGGAYSEVREVEVDKPYQEVELPCEGGKVGDESLVMDNREACRAKGSRPSVMDVLVIRLVR